MKQVWLATTLVLCGLAQALIGGQVVRADDDPTGAQLLPKDTLLFFSVPSVPEFEDEFDKSVTGSMLRDPELKPFLDDVRKKIDELSEKLQSEVGVTIPELLAIPKGEVTFAVMERPARKLAPVLIMDYGDKEPVEKLLKKMHDGLEDVSEHSTQDVGDVTVHVYTFKDQEPNSPFQSLAYFNDDSCLVFSTSVDALKEVLDRWEGDSTDTLANNDIYKYVQERCKEESSEPAVVWFVNPIGLIQSSLDMASEFAPQVGMAKLFLPTLGIDRLKGWGGASYYGSDDFDGVSKTFVHAEQPAGVLNIFQFPVADLAPPKWVPATVTAYFSANWNVPQAYQAIESLVDGVQGRGATAKQLDKIAKSEEGPGIHVKNDFLDLLDGKFHMTQRAPDDADDPSPRFLVACDVKDAAKMKKTLAKAAKSEGANIETRDFNGETVYEVTAGDDQTISMAVTGGHFVFTNDTPSLEAMLRAVSTTAPLAESAGYRKIAKRFPAKVSMIGYSRSDAQMKAAYEMLKNADNSEFLEGIDMKKLPPFEVLEKYLRPSGSYAVPDKKGALFVGFQLKEGDK